MAGIIVKLIAVFCFIFITQATCYSQSYIFGPTTYTREKGKPEETKETFQICALAGIYKVTAENGLYTATEEDKKGKKKETKTKVSAGEIKINDKEVIKEDDFNKKVTKIEKTVSIPQGENSIEIEIEGEPGAFIKVTIECQSGCLEPKITSPASGGTVNKASAIIQGNLYNLSGDAGVIFQGQTVMFQGLAQTSSSAFAGITPLQQGANTITVQATDACGYQSWDTITVNTTTVEDFVRLAIRPYSSVPSYATGTLQVAMQADVHLANSISNYSWDFNGDGISDANGATLSQTTANYTTAGLYFPAVTVTDNMGNIYTETAIVNVLSQQDMDTLLRGKWDGMRGYLAAGNTEKAIGLFEESSQSAYRNQFTALTSQLNVIVNDMGQISLVKMENDRAEYAILSARSGTTYSFYLLFVRDKNGLWKIKRF